MVSVFPHEGVWCRLGVSNLHGIGVFAMIAIPPGIDVFANDDGETVWIEAAAIDSLPAASPQRRLYRDFAIQQGTRLECPPNFNRLSVGWYVNEPRPGEEANLEVGPECAMITRREIAAGEELTIVYATFSG